MDSHQRLIKKAPHPVTRLNPVWWALVSLGVTAYGVWVAAWGFTMLIYVLWMEIAYTAALALIRVVAAKNKRPRFTVSGEKVFFFLVAVALGTACVMFIIALTFDIYPGSGLEIDYYPDLRIPVLVLGMNRLAAMVVYYFLNSRYERANPFREFLYAYIHQLVIVGIIMAIFFRYMKEFASPQRAGTIVMYLLLLKFLADLVYFGFLVGLKKRLFPVKGVEERMKRQRREV